MDQPSLQSRDHSLVAVAHTVEMIPEVKVETASYSAENPNGPTVMETITKSPGHCPRPV